jgi:hypothetical protein
VSFEAKSGQPPTTTETRSNDHDNQGSRFLREAERTRHYRAAERAAADTSTLREAALRSGKVSEEEYDKAIVPKDMIEEGSAQPDVASPSHRVVTAFAGPKQGAAQ